MTVSSYTEYTSGGGEATTHTLTYPSGVAEGDQLAIFFGVTNNSAAPSSPPSGWTEQVAQGGATAFDQYLGLYTKTAGASEPSTVDITLSQARYLYAIFMRITGTGDYDQDASANTGSSTTHTCPSITPTDSNAFTLWGVISDQVEAATATVPSGTTLLEQGSAQTGNTAAGTIAYSTETGATGTKDYTFGLAETSCTVTWCYLAPAATARTLTLLGVGQ